MVSFAEPVVTEERTYVPIQWVPPQTTTKTRGALSFSSSLLKTKPCKNCICSTLYKNECFICGKWDKKRSRCNMCRLCASGTPDTQLPCNICGELVHESCYESTDDIICTKCGDASENNNVYTTLAQQGFIVVRNAFELEEETLDLIDTSDFYPIFNGVDEKELRLTYDGKRVMATGQWRNAFKKKLIDFLNKKSLLNGKNGKKTVNEVYALRSLSGCPMQPKHADSATEEGLRQIEAADVPLAVLYAIEKNTKLMIWPFDQEHPVVIVLQPNDIVIFRGDTAHAGYKYDEENTRMHAYIDSTAPGCKRIKGKTYILVNQMYVSCKTEE